MALSIATKQRQLVADIDTNDQVDILNNLIKNAPKESRIVQISPELAQFILENKNLGNRSRKPVKIKQYATDMANNNWSLTGETIKFGTDGNLKDGQNRLAACVRSNTAFTTHAVFGIDPATFTHMDIGANRNHTDVFTIMGVAYARDVGLAVRMLMAWDRGHTDTRALATSNEELRDHYLNQIDEDVLHMGIKAARKVNRITSYPIAHLSALFYTAWKAGHSEKVKKFMEDFSMGIGSGARAPIPYLLENLARMRMDKTQTITSHMYTILLYRTWYNYMRGKASVKADMRVSSDDVMGEV